MRTTTAPSSSRELPVRHAAAMDYGLLPQPLAACAEPEGILLTFPTPGGMELHVWVKPLRGAFLTDHTGDVRVEVEGDPLRYLWRPH